MKELRPREIWYHEAAHAIFFLHYKYTYSFASIIASDEYAGVVTSCDCTQEIYEPELVEKERKTIIKDGKSYSYASKKFYRPLTTEQKEINLNHCRIYLAGNVAEEVLFGGSGDGWSGAYPGQKERENSDLAGIKRVLRYNFTTRYTHGREVSEDVINQAIEQLRSETMLMLRSDRGEMTPLWVKLCKIADELGVKHKLTFTECWKIFDAN